MTDRTLARPTRRSFVLGLLAGSLAARAEPVPGRAAAPPPDRPGARLTPWTRGCLDIHHIASGRGSSTFVLMPDGTSLLIDAGATLSGLDASAAPRPSASRRPGEWIARYAARQMHPAEKASLDYALITHLHPDHLGDVDAASPPSALGPYRLSGITDVAEAMPIGTLIDRAFPAYDYPAAHDAPFAANYIAYVRARVRAGQRVQRFAVGRDDQLRPVGSAPHATPFGIRNVAANGEIWTGEGDRTRMLFPPVERLAPDDLPNENMCSIAVKINLGNFGYFTGGDLTSYSFDGEAPWRDVLTAVARVVGPVDVATADHHGLFDGLSADVVRAFRPKAWIIPTWHISHPDTLQLERMLSERLYPGPRDVFATNVMAANLLANRRLMRRLRSTEGHVIVRVAPGGDAFSVVVTDNGDEDDTVKVVVGSR